MSVWALEPSNHITKVAHYWNSRPKISLTSLKNDLLKTTSSHYFTYLKICYDYWNNFDMVNYKSQNLFSIVLLFESLIWTLKVTLQIIYYRILAIFSSNTLHLEVRFASFLSGGFTTIAVINPPEKTLEKRTSVHCCIKKGKISSFVKYSNKNHSFKLRRERGET
jgi:hypothetical protein